MSWGELIEYPWQSISHWLIMLALIVLLSIILISLGIVWIRKAPSRYNWRWGYKIFVAKSGKAAWEYANRVMGKVLLFIGLATIPLSLIIMAPFMHKPILFIVTIGCAIIVLIALIVFIAHVLIKRRIERIYLSEVDK